MDSSHVALVSLILQEKGFSFFICHKPLTLGISLENLAKALKIVENDDEITLSYS